MKCVPSYWLGLGRPLESMVHGYGDYGGENDNIVITGDRLYTSVEGSRDDATVRDST